MRGFQRAPVASPAVFRTEARNVRVNGNVPRIAILILNVKEYVGTNELDKVLHSVILLSQQGRWFKTDGAYHAAEHSCGTCGE